MSTANPVAESREDIEGAAADFLQRRRFGSWSAAEQTELDAWLGESEARRIAFWRLEAGLGRIDRLAALRSPRFKRRTSTARLRFMVPFLASAASLAAAAVLGVVAQRYFLTPPDHTYSTETGGRALLDFADHTQIQLNTDTLVRYRMTTRERTVWLERGEAWFHVSHDAANPFTVIVGRHRITDLGTEFVVRRAPNEMEVALLKGRAAVSTQGAQTATLAPGDDAVATPVSLSVTKKTPQELADEFAWRHGVLVFRNTRLADAVKEFNRYNQTKLVITDPSVAGVKVSAEIRTDHYEDLLQLAETVLNLRVDREGNDILISRGSRETARKAAHIKRSE